MAKSAVVTVVRAGALVLLLLSVGVAYGEIDREAQCGMMVKSWAEKEIAISSSDNSSQMRDILFFLHVPRTGGRTYGNCFLKNLFKKEEICPRSYEAVKFEFKDVHCRMLSSHDDYSVLHKFPRNMSSVVTNLRKPLDRVLSAYEFAIEVAARFTLKRKKPSLMSIRHLHENGVEMAPGTSDGPVTKLSSESTLNIWPWKYLVPMMQMDIFDRRDARVAHGQSSNSTNGPLISSYAAASFVMPFHEFIHHPMAREHVHNGATFQVAGLTNISYVEGAMKIRQCIFEYNYLGQYILTVAKRRLNDMLHIGLTEHHEESAILFAHRVGAQVSDIAPQQSKPQLPERRPVGAIKNAPVNRLDLFRDTNVTSQLLLHNVNEDILAQGMQGPQEYLLNNYRSCIARLRGAQSTRRAASLKLIPVSFSKEERASLPQEVIADVLQLNRLDEELYAHALSIFEKQQQWLQKKLYQLEHEKLEQEKLVQENLEVKRVGDGETTDDSVLDNFEQTKATGSHVFVPFLLVVSVSFGIICYLRCSRKSKDRIAYSFHHPLVSKEKI